MTTPRDSSGLEEQRHNMPYVPRSNRGPGTKKPIIVWCEDLGRPECPYLRRWVLDLRLFSLRIHQWRASDDDRAFHDHPWWFLTFVIRGGYTDVSPTGADHVSRWHIRFRPALHRHTVFVDRGGALTLMLTGPETRKWGFWVKRADGTERFRKANKYFFIYGHHPCSTEHNS